MHSDLSAQGLTDLGSILPIINPITIQVHSVHLMDFWSSGFLCAILKPPSKLIHQKTATE